MISRPADPRQQMAGARRGVAQHDHVGRHRLDVHRGVGQRLALQHARRRHRDVQRVGAETLLGDLERGPRPRARLVEQVDDRLAAQRRHFLDRPLADLAHRFGGVEHAVDLVATRGRRCRADPSSFLDLHFVAAVDFGEVHLHALRQRRRKVLADVVGLDRQLAVAAVDQHHQLNQPSAARTRSARRAPRESSGRCRARRRPAGSACRRSRTGCRCVSTTGCAPTAWRIRSSR